MQHQLGIERPDINLYHWAHQRKINILPTGQPFPSPVVYRWASKYKFNWILNGWTLICIVRPINRNSMSYRLANHFPPQLYTGGPANTTSIGYWMAGHWSASFGPSTEIQCLTDWPTISLPGCIPVGQQTTHSVIIYNNTVSPDVYKCPITSSQRISADSNNNCDDYVWAHAEGLCKPI